MRVLNVALRYCGGCNPRFDRRALVDSLEKQFPRLNLSPFCSGEDYDAALVVCGCPAQCAEQEDLPCPRFVVSDPADHGRAAAFLADIPHSADIITSAIK